MIKASDREKDNLDFNVSTIVPSFEYMTVTMDASKLIFFSSFKIRKLPTYLCAGVMGVDIEVNFIANTK